MKLTKLFTLFLALALAFGPCVAPASAESEPIELIWYMVGGVKPDTDMVFEEVSKLTMERIGVKVKLVKLGWSDYDAKVTLQLAAGENIDIMFTAGWRDYYQLAQKGALCDITDLLTEREALWNSMPETVWDGARYAGRIYGVPNYKEIADSEAVKLPTEKVEQYGWDLSTIEGLLDVEPFLADLVEDPDIEIPYMPNADPFLAEWSMVIGTSVPGVVVRGDDETKIVNQYATEIFKHYVETFYRWNQAGYMPYDIATNTEGYNTEKNEGLTGIALTVDHPGIIYNAELEYGHPSTFVPVTPHYVNNGSATGGVNAVVANSQHPTEALQFIELMSTDALVNSTVVYGIEGVHYTKTEDNVVTVLNADAYLMDAWQMGNTFVTWLRDTEPATKVADYLAWNESAVGDPLLGFHFATEAVDAEIAALKNVTAQYYGPLYKGVIDPAQYLDEFLAALDAAGAQTVIDEMQRQYDEFLAAK